MLAAVETAKARATVLVVDDEPGIRAALAEVIRRAGCRAALAESAERALDAGLLADADLLVTDLRMPGMGGMELLGRARRLRPDLPVIVITGHGAVDTAVEAMKRGARDFIMKPFRSHEIEALMLRALAERAAPAPAPAPRGPEIVTVDLDMRRILEMAETVARSQATVLLEGESGVGKEVLARFIHGRSPRAAGPFVGVNCAALPEGLLESELFGHEKGAFTGAIRAVKGKFELAGGGTILLDEVSEMPLALQAKLLRVLQEREVDPVGARAPLPVDIRVIATTNRDLARAVASGAFREDLFFRLSVVPISLPPLRARAADIAALAAHFAAKHAARLGAPPPALEEGALARLRAHPWPGNVRELENVLERSLVLARGKTRLGPEDIRLGALGPETGSEAPEAVRAAGRFLTLRLGATIQEMERRLIEKTLEDVSGNRTRAAEVLGISVRTLRNKLSEYRRIDGGG